MTTSLWWRTWPLVAGMVCSMAAAQIFFKLAGLHSLHQTDQINAWILNPWLWVALITSLLGMVFWLCALRHLPLSIAYPWTAMIYVLAPLGSAVFFHDVLTLRYTLGMACIIAGIFITTSSASK